MKILFVITAYGHGSGGHFHSLNHISRKISEDNDVKILSIGPGYSPIIAENPYFFKHIVFNGFNIRIFKREVKAIHNDFNPDIIHCFDDACYNIIRLFINRRGTKFVLNKCGGPNLKLYPAVGSLVVFSRENFEWFSAHKKYRQTRIYLIPNRVKAISIDASFQPIEVVDDEFAFVRICRIGETYKKSILDSFNLISYLSSQNLGNVKLYLIGAVESHDLYQQLKANELVQKKKIVILKDPLYTSEASKMLYLADAVIGTGRGLMESSSLSKPLLVINKSENYPTLLTAENFQDAFRTNFSERNDFKAFDLKKNLSLIKNLVVDKLSYQDSSKFSKEIFNEYFDIDKVGAIYAKVYKDAVSKNGTIVVDLYLVLKSIFNFMRSSINK